MIKSVYNILENAGIRRKDKIICAVSGGIDSVCMLHLLKSYGLDCIIAHCNFQLRGEESNGDEEFVRQLAKELDSSIAVKTFETQKFASDNGISIQMAARDLRFDFFVDLLTEYKCQYIALGHNSDDQIETVLTNFIRGTGLRGLTGMAEYKECFIRPLLNVSRDNIVDFAKEKGISFREDSTNKTIKYSRNKLRHVVIPALSEIKPSAKENMLKTIDILKDNEEIFNDYITQAYKNCVSVEKDLIRISTKALEKYKSVKTVLFEILLRLDLPVNLASDSVNLIDSQTGKYCESDNYLVLKDRDELKISLKQISNEIKETKLSEEDLNKKLVIQNIEYHFEIIELEKNYQISKDSNIAFLDYNKLDFPLIIRSKKEGDKFKPLGMNNFKKLSDFFVDMKLSMTEKERIHVFQTADNICWIAGFRIDDRYKLSSDTKKILKILRRKIV